jgi:hypothetical protein
VVIGNPAVATFAAFGSFALLLLVDFSGSISERLRSQAALVVAGAALICIGTLASRSTWLATATTAVVAFAVLFAGIVSSVLAAATVSLLLGFVLGLDRGARRISGRPPAGASRAGCSSRSPSSGGACERSAATTTARTAARAGYGRRSPRPRTATDRTMSATPRSRPPTRRWRRSPHDFAIPHQPAGPPVRPAVVHRRDLWLNTVIVGASSTGGLPATGRRRGHRGARPSSAGADLSRGRAALSRCAPRSPSFALRSDRGSAVAVGSRGRPTGAARHRAQPGCAQGSRSRPRRS